MSRYIIRKTLYAALAGFIVVTFSFLILRLAPGDPISLMFDIAQEHVPDELIQRLTEEFGLDLPLHQQYISYMGNLLRGDLGTSVYYRRPVSYEIRRNFLPTMVLAVGGVSVSVILGVGAGTISALRRNTLPDYLLTTLSLVALAAPNFWFALLLIYFVAFQWGWLPVISRPETFIEHLRALILPAIAIGARGAGMTTRMTRSSVLEVLGSDYIRTAHAKGLHGRTVVIKHALRNASIPVVTIVGLSFAVLLGGAVAIELVFGRAGLGQQIINAIRNRDYPLLQGTLFAFVFLIIGVNLLIDILYGFLDPRIRYD